MPGLAVVETINAPIDRVFELATDLPRAAQHIDGIDKIELLTEGPIGMGTRWRETRTMMGREATEEMWITAFDPPSGSTEASYTAEAESCGCHYWSTFSFEAIGDTTQVTMGFRGEGRSLMAKLMSPLSGLMMGSIKKMIAQDLADLKRVAEASEA